jgi:predicted 3-demethylubiquinone-9 3-methyltransferase (glyoxalase superfamily)
MAKAITTFLMFDGAAEQAMKLYVSLFGDAEITVLEHFGPGEPGPEGTVKRGWFRIGSQSFRCFDSPMKHPFTFTPSMSIFVDCADAAEQERLYAALSENGKVLMPLDHYGFSTRFGWVNDRFGVSWQINLP